MSGKSKWQKETIAPLNMNQNSFMREVGTSRMHYFRRSLNFLAITRIIDTNITTAKKLLGLCIIRLTIVMASLKHLAICWGVRAKQKLFEAYSS